MLTSLALTISLSSAPQLPLDQGPAVFAVQVENTRLTAHNYSADVHWLILENGCARVWRRIQPHSSLSWEFPTSCLLGVELRVVRPAQGALWQSGSYALGEHAQLYFSKAARAYTGVESALEPVECRENPWHVPVIRPEARPSGGTPPKIGDQPLPPV